MSRRRTDKRAGGREATVAGVMAGVLPALPLSAGDRVLLIDAHPSAEVAFARVAEVLSWRRRGEGARPWPAAERAEAAALRLPRGRALLTMLLHAAAARLPEGAPIWVYGASDEGIKSTPGRLAPLFHSPEVLDTRRRCRVIQATRSAAPARGALDDHAEVVSWNLPRGPVRALSWPGLFAHGRLDPGSALLIGTLEARALSGRVLDYGCGAGALAAAALQVHPEARLTLLDTDALALHAAGINLPGAERLAGSSLAALPRHDRFAHILSNPPFHAGRDEDFGPITALIREAPGRLLPGGDLRLVTQRTAGLRPLLSRSFRRVDVAAQDRSYQVWLASHPR